MLDPKTVDELRLLDAPGRDEVFRDVLLTFLEDAPLRLDSIAAAVVLADAAAIRRAAHALKGSCRTVGALDVAELCATLERQPDSSPAAQVQALRDCLAATRAEIEHLLSNGGDASPTQGD